MFLTTLLMAGVDISSEDLLMIQELLSLKAHFAATLSASTEPRMSFYSSTLLRCGNCTFHGNFLAKDMTEVVIDDGVAFIKLPKLKGGLHEPKHKTKHVSRCEAEHASQGNSNSIDDDDIRALEELRTKLAIWLAPKLRTLGSHAGGMALNDTAECCI